MGDTSKKRSRKSKLVPREDEETDDDNVANMQNISKILPKKSLKPSTSKTKPKKQKVDFEALIDSDKQNTVIMPPREFSVTVAVEEFDENEHDLVIDEQPPEETVEKPPEPKTMETAMAIGKITKKDPSQHYVLDRDVILNDTMKIQKESHFTADQILSIETRNMMGNYQKYVLNPFEAKIDKAIEQWQAWKCAMNLKFKANSSLLFYKCYMCQKSWWYLYDFREHLRYHENFKLHIEEYSKVEVNIIAAPSTAKAPEIKNFATDGDCPKCGEKYAMHIITRTGENGSRSIVTQSIYKCSVPNCSRSFSTCYSLRQHKYTNHTMTEITGINVATAKWKKSCNICGFVFVSPGTYQGHMDLMHSVRSDDFITTGNKKCVTCHSQIAFNLLHECPEKGVVAVCKFCSKSFSETWVYNNHMKRTETFTCPICKTVLSMACMKVKHLLQHTKEFVCVQKCLLCVSFTVFLDEREAKSHEWFAHKCYENKFYVEKDGACCYMDYVLLPKSCLVTKVMSRSLLENRQLHLRVLDDAIKNKSVQEAKMTIVNNKISVSTSGMLPKITKSNKKGPILIKTPQKSNLAIASCSQASTSSAGTPSVSETPAISGTPVPSETSSVSGTPTSSETPLVAETPSVSVTPASSGTPSVSGTPSFSGTSSETVTGSELKPVITASATVTPTVASTSGTDAQVPLFNIIIKEEPIDEQEFEIKQEPDYSQPGPEYSTKISTDYSTDFSTDIEIKQEIDDDQYIIHIQEPEQDLSKILGIKIEHNIKIIHEHELDYEDDIIKFDSNYQDYSVENDYSINNDDNDDDTDDNNDDNNEEMSNIPDIISKIDHKQMTKKIPKLYRCHRCGYQGKHNDYRYHLKTQCAALFVYGKGDYRCTKCLANFDELAKYIEHFVDHGFNVLQCIVCARMFESVADIPPHLSRHIMLRYIPFRVHSKPGILLKFRYKCKICHQNVIKKDCFQHWENHFTLKEVEAPKDNKEITKISDMEAKPIDGAVLSELLDRLRLPDYRNHMQMKCIICQKSFSRKHDCKRHMIEHLLSDAYSKKSVNECLMCQICFKGYLKPEPYKKHMRDHACLPIYQCQICDNKTFSDSSNFAKHKKLHDKNAYQCDNCGRKFTAKVSIEKHMKLHATQQPVVCKLCGEIFPFQSSYNKHAKTHHSKLKFPCQTCRVKFETLRERWDHSWQVHGERKIKADCTLCSNTYRKISDLKRHMKIQHHMEFIRKKANVIPERNKKRYISDVKVLKTKNRNMKTNIVTIAADSPTETLIVYT